MKKLFLLLVVVSSVSANAQLPLPTDYLTKEFHQGRREALRQIIPANSVVVIFSYPERVYSADNSYLYHPNPDMYYFSGYNEPDAMLLIFKEDQHKGDTAYNELFFVRKRNPLREQWNGKRLGVEGAQKELGFKYVVNSDEFKNFSIDFSTFNKILYDIIPADASGQLASLVKSFKAKANIKYTGNRSLQQAFNTITNSTSASNLQTRVSNLKSQMADSDDDEFRLNPILLELINKPDSVTLAAVGEKIKADPLPTQQYHKLTALLREIKTPEELELLRKSAYYSAIAHVEVMKALQPNMSETEVTGIFEYIHKKSGAEKEGYSPIVGTGANGCILHYVENNVMEVGNNNLVLMDVASEYHGYSADVTRTVPANGRFTAEQKAIYQIVYDAQEEVFKLCKEGTPFTDLNKKATEVLADGLLKLGIITDKKDIRKYYIHGVSHHLGLDVHDKNTTTILKENMVITVEPGIYIPKGSACDPKWWDISVRIEDDVIIGKNGCKNISAAAPRTIEAVEKTAAEKSVLNQLILPKMK
jgi:Xaa-Pro aminopeptidase